MKKSIFLFFAAILCSVSASAWSYKTAANGWKASTSGFTWVTMNSGKSVDVVMLKDVGDGVNICQNDNGSGHTLYCKWTKTSGDIFRGTARWHNNGLYSDETVVVPGGKVYIKVGSGTQVQMTAGADYTYTADVTFSNTGESYTISGGTVSGATIKAENSMPSGGKPSSLTMSNSYTSKNAGSVHIVFDLRTNKVTETAASEPDPEPEPTVTLYFVNHPEWTNLKAHVWDNNDTPYKDWNNSESMTNTGEDKDGYAVYSYTFPSKYTNIIFKGDGQQTQNNVAAYDVAKPYFCDDKWYASLAEIPALGAVVTYDYYVIGTVNGWALKDANFGMTDDNADGVYEKVVTLADGKNQMKINNGTWDKQAGYDQLDAKYEGVSRGTSGDDNNIIINIATGKDITVKFDKNANKITLDGLTKIEDYYTVVGTEALFGTAWDRANADNNMEKLGDGSYKLVKENVTLAAITYEWKIAKNGDWWNDAATGVNPADNKNNNLVIATAGRYNVTFTLAADLKSATATTELLEAAVVIPDCFISGNATLTGGEGWQGNEFTMVYDEETETWSYTLAGLQPEKAYELKVVCGGTWYSFANLATPVPTGITEGNDHSIAFKMAEAGDVTVTYNVEAGITLSGNFAEPAPEVSVTLYFVNADKWTNLKAHIWVDPSDVSYKPWEESESLTDTGDDHNGADIYSYTFSNKYNRIIWKGDDAKQTTNDVAAYDVAKPYYCQGVWYASLSDIPAVVEKKYYVKGTHNEWTADATSEMTLDGEVYKKEVTLAKDVEFKINDGADGWWGKDNLGGKSYNELEGLEGGNLKMKEAKTFTIIFNPAEHLITFDDLTEKAPVVSTYVLMGVGGDWTTGITMTVNPNDANEYVLKGQTISKANDALKVVAITDGTQTAWYSDVDTWSNATYSLVDDGYGGKNIVLEDGTYNFYFKKTNNLIYIEEVYTRNVSNTYGTICLPYGSNSYDGATFYEIVGKEIGKVYLGSVSELEAGVPYIFEATASKIIVARKGDPVADAGSSNGLIGTFADETPVEDGHYILLNNEFRMSDGTSKVNANRAYVNMNAISGGKPDYMPGRKYIGMGVQGENEATGVEDIFSTDTPVKVIENGQLIIIRDGVKYNVQGQKL